ncbi:MAG TPA: cytochrome c-type biogenesis protein [Devosiaceae bacterium]|jgi:cytochrome c-type biogenesis protein CcmH
MKRLAALTFVLMVLLPNLAFALNPSEILADPALEARARAIGSGLRCLVCQNESIEESDADLAHDLRVIVRERLTAGDTDEQAVQYIVDRYGEFVLLQPVVAPHTILLWIAAPVLLLGGVVAVVVGVRRRRNVPLGAAPTDEEQEALDALAALENAER